MPLYLWGRGMVFLYVRPTLDTALDQAARGRKPAGLQKTPLRLFCHTVS